jgi:hypothetical protein
MGGCSQVPTRSPGPWPRGGCSTSWPGFATPIDAIRKLASREEVDEIIVSTLPRRLSRWIAMDLPHRVRRATKLPVTHITGPAGPSL